MENLIKQQLKLSVLKPFGVPGGGCISSGQSFDSDHELGRLFVKSNSEPGAKLMFDGEYESLKAMIVTNTVRVPRPVIVVKDPGSDSSCLVTQFLDMKSASSKHAVLFGQQLARMHKHNEIMTSSHDEASIHKQDNEQPTFTDKFGFHVATSCGFLPQYNTWHSDWVEFYTNKLQHLINLIEKEYGDREVNEMWSELKLKIPKMFDGLNIKPALVHGDMWGGNIAEDSSGPVLFDPSSFYGHSEFEFGISSIFSSCIFNERFFSAYHDIIPKQPGFQQRQKLYQLFHLLNHWNHFGTAYRGSTVSTMQSLIK
ncbi:FN3KRP (predicted) [Pycnogonum litorale]